MINYNGGRAMLRDVTTSGYGRALADVATPDYIAAYRVRGPDEPGSEGPTVKEYFSHPATSPFGSPAASLRLPVEETPEFPPDDPKTWAVVDSLGADPTGKKDSADAIQRALDSGAATVFLPGHYATSKTLVVGPKVRRIVGAGGHVNYGGKLKPDLRVAATAADAPPLTIEHFSHAFGGIENAGDRTLVLRSIGARVASAGKGKLFLEDVAGDDLRVGKGQRVFARQLNIENEGTHLLNDGGDVWVLGYKTERGGTLADTRGGGRTEVLGGFSYTTTAGKLAPMFVTDESAAFAYFHEVCYSGDPYKVLVRETRGGVTKEVGRGEGGTWPYVGVKP